MQLLYSLVVVLVGLQRASSYAPSKHVVCGKLEKYVACPNSCDRDDCSKLVERRPCDPVIIPCKGRCMCKDGYFRNGRGDCVPGALCFKSCDVNEEWDDCPDSCDDKLCPVDGKELLCRPAIPSECIGRCVCSAQFYRDSGGKCVSKHLCDKCTNKHEVFACGSACDTTCATLTKPCPIINIVCNQKCYCQNGYARDKMNVCIPAKKCNTENSCKANEEFLTDGTACEVTCANQNEPTVCTTHLVAGCFCKKGFIRNELGDCIMPENCPAICNDNEEWKECPSNCDDMQCPIDEIEVQCQPGQAPVACFGRCVCQSGYFRNNKGKCIAKDTCAMQCKNNEVWNPSPNSCNDQPCSSVNRECTPNKRGESEGRCVCADGFYRDLNGDCASREDCMKCTKSHEVFGCGSACDTNCATLGKPCPIFNIVCNQKCYCQNGYARDKNKVCIPVKKCTTENSCAAKEVFSTCGTACEETCANRGETIICTEQCVSGCFCKEGFIKNASGVCIKPAQCPSDPTCGKNEEYKCRSRCVVTCQNKHQQHLAGACVPGCVNSCYCKEGFIRNRDYLCVPEDQCDIDCDTNEEWSYCRPQCGEHTCETLDNTPNCSLIQPQVCREGCVCAPGFYRNVKGYCVRKEECANQCDSNEDYMRCLGCPPLDCESLYTSYNCNSANKRCTPGCECAEGYLRDFNNICVPGDQCPAYPQCGENEHYTRCGSKCQNTCGIPRRSCSARCVPGCMCDEGYIRDTEYGKCILPTECPNNCDAHEVFAPCKLICPAQQCGVRPELIRCAQQPCIPGCDCEEGFLRVDIGGPCIPKSECPATPGCGENEYLQECPVDCPTDKCQTEITPIPQCLPPFPCQPAKCKCIASFKRNRDGVCVPVNECPCNKNETFSECGCDKTCLYDEETECDGQCRRGCFCNYGFVRDEDGVCILEEDCPDC